MQENVSAICRQVSKNKLIEGTSMFTQDQVSLPDSSLRLFICSRVCFTFDFCLCRWVSYEADKKVCEKACRQVYRRSWKDVSEVVYVLGHVFRGYMQGNVDSKQRTARVCVGISVAVQEPPTRSSQKSCQREQWKYYVFIALRKMLWRYCPQWEITGFFELAVPQYFVSCGASLTGEMWISYPAAISITLMMLNCSH